MLLRRNSWRNTSPLILLIGNRSIIWLSIQLSILRGARFTDLQKKLRLQIVESFQNNVPQHKDWGSHRLRSTISWKDSEKSLRARSKAKKNEYICADVIFRPSSSTALKTGTTNHCMGSGAVCELSLPSTNAGWSSITQRRILKKEIPTFNVFAHHCVPFSLTFYIPNFFFFLGGHIWNWTIKYGFVLWARAYLPAHRNHPLCVLGLRAQLWVLHPLSVHLKLRKSLMTAKTAVLHTNAWKPIQYTMLR